MAIGPRCEEVGSCSAGGSWYPLEYSSPAALEFFSVPPVLFFMFYRTSVGFFVFFTHFNPVEVMFFTLVLTISRDV